MFLDFVYLTMMYSFNIVHVIHRSNFSSEPWRQTMERMMLKERCVLSLFSNPFIEHVLQNLPTRIVYIVSYIYRVLDACLFFADKRWILKHVITNFRHSLVRGVGVKLLMVSVCARVTRL